MMNMRKLQLAFVFILLFAGCGKDKTDAFLLEADKKKLAESLNYDKIFFYKYVKIALRASAVQDTTLPEYQLFSKRTNRVLNNLSEVSLSGKKEVSVTEALLMYRDYRAINKLVKETDEDIFPTLSEAISNHYGNKNEKAPSYAKDDKIYYQNVEHAVLSMIVLATRDLGKDFALYECSKTQPEGLKDSEEKTLLEFVRGMLFFTHQLHYLSEDGLSRNITWLNSHKELPLPYTKAFFGWGNFNNEQTHTAFLGMNYLFRGFDRLMMKRDIDEERGLDDFELFLAESEKLNLQNESIWAIESYLYLKREKPERAIAALRKLQGSPLCDQDEKDAIEKAIGYAGDRKPGKALNGVYDKLFISKIITRYTFSVLAKIDWQKVMQDKKVPYTAELFTTMNSFKHISDAVSGYMQPSVVESGKEKLMKEGGSLVDKAKGIF